MRTQCFLGNRALSVSGAIAGIALLPGMLLAAPFTYSSGDLLLTFRQAGNASDFVVNLGRATHYNQLPEGSHVAVAALSDEQFALAFPSINGVSWSVGGVNRPPEDSSFPLQTLWTTAPRQTAETPALAWARKGTFVQGTTGGQIAGVAANAVAASSVQPAGPDNTQNGVVIPATSDFAVSPLLGDGGDYAGTFQGRVEAVTPDDFDSDLSQVSRVDLYELLPGTTSAGTLNTPSRFLGYFELKADGTLSFSNSASVAPVPVISSVSRTGDETIVSFPTASGARYTLRAVDASGIASPISGWSTGESVTGDGAVKSLRDTSAAPGRFYVVEVAP